jgi:hypothetical protein
VAASGSSEDGRASAARTGWVDDLRQQALSEADLGRILQPDQLKQVVARLGDALGWATVDAGATVAPRVLTPELVQRLLLPALTAAAGAAPGDASLTARPLLWDNGVDQLLVHLDKSSVVLADGVIDLHLAVECDQTGVAEVVATYVTASPDKPHGFVFATEDKPRGPAVVVQLWGEALVALGWRALVELARMVAGTRGTDTAAEPLVASTVVATANGLAITAMGAQRFGTRVVSRRPGTIGGAG